MKLPSATNDPRQKIIVALDVPDAKKALAMVRELRDRVGIFKIGLQLFIAEGPEIVRAIVGEGASVFLDLKLHDIPNTVARAVESAATLGVSMLTLHLAGGAEMLRAAAAAAPRDLLLLGVTVLTSSNQATLRSVGVASTVENQVVKLATLGVECGIRGFVASAHELAALRGVLPVSAQFVVPGIRAAGQARGDQQRVMSASEAIRLGAHYLVIGRPITATSDPRAACDLIAAEIASCA